MKKTEVNIEIPALGCKIGRAWQILTNQLAFALRDAELDITTNEYMILRAVYRNEGMQQREIAEMTGKDKATVCRCVAALEKKGLVTTVAVSHKCLRVYLTDSSREMKPKIMAVAASRHKDFMALSSPDEIEIFTHILDNIINKSKKERKTQ